MIQTSVTDPARGYAGQLNHQFPKAAVSRAAEGGGIVAGQPVLKGTADDQVVAVTDGATVDATTLEGFAILETSRAYNSDGAIEDKDPCTTLRKGRMYITTADTVVKNAQVYVGNATAQLGLIGNSGTGMVAAPGVFFAESGTGIITIDLDL